MYHSYFAVYFSRSLTTTYIYLLIAYYLSSLVKKLFQNKHLVNSLLSILRWWSRRTCTHLIQRELQNYPLLPLTGECWIPPKKDTSHPRAKEKPQQDQQDIRRGEITFRIKHHTCQRCSEGSNKTWCTPRP